MLVVSHAGVAGSAVDPNEVPVYERQPDAGLPVVSMSACRWFPRGVPVVKA